MGIAVGLVVLVAGLAKAGEPSASPTMDLVMPGARPTVHDAYICASFDVSNMTGGMEPVHVTGFVPHAKANKAHHMLLYACTMPMNEPGIPYDCMHHAMCRGGQSIMFAWAKNAPPTSLPQGVSFLVDPGQRRYLVLQIHYAKPLPDADHTGLSLQYQREETKYQAGILLMLRSGLSIPPNTAVTHGDVNCVLPSNTPLHMFGYRTHAHALGSVITGYVYNEKNHKYRQIAAGSPQWPQAFYPMKKINTVQPGEVVTARCTYNSTGVNHETHIGGTAGDEMCNLYIMYFTEVSKSPGDYLTCAGEQAGHYITRGLPADSDLVPEKRPELEAKASDSSATGGPNEINYAQLFEEELLKGTSKKKVLDQPDGMVVQAQLNVTMPGVSPSKDDDYICTGVSIGDLSPDKTVYAVSFSALGQDGPGIKAHHMILSKCKKPKKTGFGDTWDCQHHAMCNDQSKILFAWAKHAQPTELPNDVGFSLQPDEYLVLQVHYAKPQQNDHSGLAVIVRQAKPTYTAGMFLLLRSRLEIPPFTPAVHGDVNCQANLRSPIHVFAYRTHAHSLGSVISGYRFTVGDSGEPEWKEIAKGNPNWPQAFYPMKSQLVVNPGDILAARCTYNTTGHSTATRIGSTGGDEMCNLYLMFYTLSSEDDFLVCADEQNPSLTRQLPSGSDTPLPPRPELENQAQGAELSGLSYANGGGSAHHQFYPVPEKKQDGSVRKRPGVDDSAEGRQPKALPGSDLSADPNWPTAETAKALGQLSGVSIDTYGNAVIFHRGDRTWTGQTFNLDNTYGLDRSVPIPQATVLTVNSSGHTINSWGQGLFFLPHMITVDKQNNVWVTDVALHQVFKFGPYGGNDQKPLIALGTRFEPGSDETHYCKPTSVAVTDDGNTFFVSDGYCNSRIIKYKVTVEQGSGRHQVQKVTEWGRGAGPFTLKPAAYNFNIPHGLALAEDKNEVCVADRENGRVQCFNLEGEFTKTVKPSEFGSRIFSTAYTKANGGQLHAVSGPEFSLNPWVQKPTGYIIKMDTGELTGTWNVPGGLQNPHDIAVTEDGNTVYVCELNPFKVWKLTNGAPSTSPLPASLPNSKAASTKSKAAPILPDLHMSSSVLMAAAVSVPLSILIAVCLAVRRCRKRGRGHLGGKEGKRGKEWGVGKLLQGRDREGFKPLDTEERDGMLDDDSDSEVEEFSIPANHA